MGGPFEEEEKMIEEIQKLMVKKPRRGDLGDKGDPWQKSISSKDRPCRPNHPHSVFFTLTFFHP